MSHVSLLLHNIRSAYNVGSILRTAEGFGVRSIIFSGYTPRYNDEKLLPHLREKLNREITKTALGAEKLLQLENSDDVLRTIDSCKEGNYLVVGLENNLSDSRLLELDFKNLSTLQDALSRPNKKLLLCLGEEVFGIPSELRAKMDYFLEIPMQGKKESFNVSVATGIALFALMQILD